MHFPIRKGLFRRTVGHVKAVDGVSLDIFKGETVALVGESGCGKTTVGRCMVRLLDPTAGTITYLGDDVQSLRGKALQPFRRRIQMMFQDPNSCLNPRLMIQDIIAEGMHHHGIGSSNEDRQERIQAIMERVGLDASMMTRYPHEFSGGQRQRIGLARGLAVEPDLLICDEATSSLDVSVQAQILNLLKELQSDLGLSYLFITHDLSVVKYLADRVFVMYLGRIVESGQTADIFRRPKHPYTRALLSAVPQLDTGSGHQRILLEGDVPSPANPPSGCPFHPRCSYAVPACSTTVPQLEPDIDNRQVACIRKDELDLTES
ncbi:MAG: ATP-binding cassette domain-containing protein [Verrucomicrobia bacterium]|nr:ATP-binding cassette domain-containing protein [Verrucomicrobiota bacterium]